MGRRFAVSLAAALALAAAAAPRAGADTSAQIFETLPPYTSPADIDPSARSAAMGGAAGAVFWGDVLDAWANPALLGYASGVIYEQGHAAIEGDRIWSTHSMTLGAGGAGVLLAGQPFAWTDQVGSDARIQSTDASGNVLTWEFENRARSWGAGVSFARLAATLAGLRGREAPAIARHADVAVGFQERVGETSFTGAPGLRLVTQDLGLLGRLGTDVSLVPEGAALRLDAAYGLTTNVSQRDVRRNRRSAIAARAALHMGRRWLAAKPTWLAPALDPLLSLGVARDDDHRELALFRFSGTTRTPRGVELGLTRVLALQLGSQGGSDYAGLTLTLPMAGFGEARYQHERLLHGGMTSTQDAWSLRLQPLAFLHR